MSLRWHDATLLRRCRAFLNSFMSWPRVLASSGSFLAAGDHILASFNGNYARDARFSWRRAPPFWETPEPMATFAVSLMRNKAKKDAEV